MRQFEVLLGEWEGNKETLMRKLQPICTQVVPESGLALFHLPPADY